MVKIGIIGGSGLDDPQILQDAKEINADTPYGKPSSALTVGRISHVDTVLLTRHGKKHELSPTEVNYRANIRALKDQGVTHILATTACGSLREDIDRGDFIIPDQFIDFAKHRKNTFHESFKDGMEHPVMADPFDADLRKTLYETSAELGFRTHNSGTVVTIEVQDFPRERNQKCSGYGGGCHQYVRGHGGCPCKRSRDSICCCCNVNRLRLLEGRRGNCLMAGNSESV